MFLGENLLAWLVLAIGAAMAAGNLTALVRPPRKVVPETASGRPPLTRTLITALIGITAGVWALSSLLA